MDAFVFDMLSLLKARFEAAGGAPRYQVGEAGRDVSARQFYLARLEDNLVRPLSARHRAEYARGSGGELEGKMNALRSSSAMTFNLLGNGRCELEGAEPEVPDGAYRVSYERQLPTLRTGLPANLDAYLVRSDGRAVIACEMKLLEWLTAAPRPLKAKYFDPTNHLHRDAAGTFIEVARALEASGRFRRYDFAQMFKHSLALYNAVRAPSWEGAERLVLLNCVWEPGSVGECPPSTRRRLAAAVQEEHEGFAAFRDACRPLVGLFAREGVAFSLAYRTSAELIAARVCGKRERDKLRRYC